MKRTKRQHPAGFTLVEVIATAAILATLTTSSFVLVRTASEAWRRHRNDSQQRLQGVATLQHIVRRVRQASEVTAISSAADVSGSITLLMPDGSSAIWDHVSGTNQILYGPVTPTNLLAAGITELRFVGLKADGTTATTTPALIHSVQCTLKYSLVRPAGPTVETVSCTTWLRAW